MYTYMYADCIDVSVKIDCMINLNAFKPNLTAISNSYFLVFKSYENCLTSSNFLPKVKYCSA